MTIQLEHGTLQDILSDYPDVLTTAQLCEILHKSDKTVRKLLKAGDIQSKKIGRSYIIPKIYVINYLLGTAN